MRVSSINSVNYNHYFQGKRKVDNQNNKPVSQNILPAAVLALTLMSGANACSPDTLDHDRLNDKEDTFERADSTRDDDSPVDIIVDTTYNDIIYDFIVFEK